LSYQHQILPDKQRTDSFTAVMGDKTAMRPFAKLLWTLVSHIEVGWLSSVVGEDADGNAVEYSSTRSEPSTGFSESCSSEKPKDADSVSDNSNVAGCAEAVENSAEANSTQDDSIDSKLVSICQPLVLQSVALNPSEQLSAAEAAPLTASMQPNPPKVSDRKKKRTFGSKKRSQTRKARNASSEAGEGTWRVSSCEDSDKKNVVLIRRQHLTEMPDACHELAVCQVLETAAFSASQSQVSCETNSDAENRNVSSKMVEGDTIPEHVTSVTQGPSGDTMNTATIDNAHIQTDISDDTSARNVQNVDSVASTDGRDVTGNRSTKRRQKMTTKREACRKSLRCRSRRRNAEEIVDKMPGSASTAEVRTDDLYEDAQNALPYSVSTGRVVLQEKVVSAQDSANVHDKTVPVITVSSCVTPQTEENMGLSDAAMLNCSSAAPISSDNTLKPMESVASTENADLVSESALKSLSTGFVDQPGITCSSEAGAVLNSATDISSSSCAGNVQSTSPTALEIEPPVNNTENNTVSSVVIKVDNDALNRVSDRMYCSSSAADMSACSRPSSDASLLNTCLVETILETSVSPKEHLTQCSISQQHGADETDQELQSTGVTQTGSSLSATSGDESESEEVCKTMLEEVVANVVKETCLMSTTNENVEDVASLSESTGSGTGCSMVQNESDSTSGEIPLKKRRGRRVFADCQPENVSTAPRRSDDVHRPPASSHRRKVANSSSRSHRPRGNKYVGAHTSIIGKLLC